MSDERFDARIAEFNSKWQMFRRQLEDEFGAARMFVPGEDFTLFGFRLKDVDDLIELAKQERQMRVFNEMLKYPNLIITSLDRARAELWAKHRIELWDTEEGRKQLIEELRKAML